MPNHITIAVAGSGKTASIVDMISRQPPEVRSLALTYTRYAQSEITSRLSLSIVSEHETMGWFGFLVKHVVRPYLPNVFPGIRASGLNFVQTTQDIPKDRKGWAYYFDDMHRPYSARLSLLAKKVIEKSKGAVIRRLEAIYDAIYLDEFQDFVGNDLVIVEYLMRSQIVCHIVADPRQAVLQTSASDRLHREYRGVEVVTWFRRQADLGLCDVTPQATTSRFNQLIADFSDLIHNPAFMFPPTNSTQSITSSHDGVFLVDQEHLESYLEQFSRRPTILRTSATGPLLPEVEVLNFGASKGITRDRVAIMATKPIGELLTKRKLLAPKSAAGFYVAVTRARYSVAIVLKDASRIHGTLHSEFAGRVRLWNALQLPI